MAENMMNMASCTSTIVAPTGDESKIEMKIPSAAARTEVIAEHIMTCLKVLKTRIADSAGKIINAEVSKAPTRFIAKTMIIAVTTAVTVLYKAVFAPVAFAKFSSNVTAKILL